MKRSVLVVINFSHFSAKDEKDGGFNGLRRSFVPKDTPWASRNLSTKISGQAPSETCRGAPLGGSLQALA
jgi:hypothetical protein